MKRITTLAALATVILGALLIGGCGSGPASVQFGTMSVHMTDAPGDFDAVNLVITEVSASMGGGWQVLAAEPGTYDLLSLRNGVFAQLATSSLPAGHYEQVRLLLAEGSTVVVDGVEYPLVIPSGLRSGLKLDGAFDVPPGGDLDIQLDFDAEQSISQNGAGTWILNPVTRILPAAAAGAIDGQIWPTNTVADVFVMQGGSMVSSTQTNADGTFQVSVLPAGLYDVTVRPVAFYQEELVPGIVVAAGGTTNLGVIELRAPWE